VHEEVAYNSQCHDTIKDLLEFRQYYAVRYHGGKMKTVAAPRGDTTS